MAVQNNLWEKPKRSPRPMNKRHKSIIGQVLFLRNARIPRKPRNTGSCYWISPKKRRLPTYARKQRIIFSRSSPPRQVPSRRIPRRSPPRGHQLLEGRQHRRPRGNQEATEKSVASFV